MKLPNQSTLGRSVFAVSLAAVVLAGSVYDFDRAFRNVQLAGAAYCPQNTIENWECWVCKQLPTPRTVSVVTDDRFQLQAYVARVDDEVVVSFRGTVPYRLYNWLVDLDATKEQYPPQWEGALVHKGFLAGYNGLKREIAEFLETQEDVRRVSITGHSLGGAMATLCLADLALTFPQFAYELHTFGAPRVGNARFAEQMNELNATAWRVVHRRDVVPQVPFRFMGFEHANDEVWYVSDLEFEDCGKRENPRCSFGSKWLSARDHLNYLGLFVSNAC